MIQLDERDYQAMKEGAHMDSGNIIQEDMAEQLTAGMSKAIGGEVFFTIGGLVLREEMGGYSSVPVYQAGHISPEVDWRKYIGHEEAFAIIALRGERKAHASADALFFMVTGEMPPRSYAALFEFNVYAAHAPFNRLHACSIRLSSTKDDQCVICCADEAEVQKDEPGRLAPFFPGYEFGGDATLMSDGIREGLMAEAVQRFETKLRSMN